MKKFLLPFIVLISLAGLLIFSNSREKITNFPSSGTDVIAFGDSLVVGVGASEKGGFVTILSQELDLPIVNLGISGDTTARALERINTLDQYKPKVVIVLLGGNDFLQGIPEVETFVNLEKIIYNIHKRGSAVLLLGLEDKKLGNKHRQSFDTLAEKTAVLYLPNILDGIYGNPTLSADTLHPNDAGYRIIANKIRPVLEKLTK